MRKYIKPEVNFESVMIDEIICLSSAKSQRANEGEIYGLDDGFWNKY